MTGALLRPLSSTWRCAWKGVVGAGLTGVLLRLWSSSETGCTGAWAELAVSLPEVPPSARRCTERGGRGAGLAAGVGGAEALLSPGTSVWRCTGRGWTDSWADPDDGLLGTARSAWRCRESGPTGARGKFPGSLPRLLPSPWRWMFSGCTGVGIVTELPILVSSAWRCTGRDGAETGLVGLLPGVMVSAWRCMLNGPTGASGKLPESPPSIFPSIWR